MNITIILLCRRLSAGRKFGYCCLENGQRMGIIVMHGGSLNVMHGGCLCTQGNLFEFFLNQTEIRLYIPFSD